MSLPAAFVLQLLLNPSNYLKNNHPPSLSSRCILTFEVLFSIKSAKGPFKRVNEVDVIFTSYHHTLSEGEKGNVLNTDSVKTFLFKIVFSFSSCKGRTTRLS